MTSHRDIIEFYKRLETQKAICKWACDREFAMLSVKGEEPAWAHRALDCSCPEQFRSFMKCSGMLTGEVFYNLYRSVAIFNASQFTYIGDPNKRIIQERVKLMFDSIIIGYDLVIDIDADGAEELGTAKRDLLKLIEFYDDHKIPYYVVFSGMGFHLITPWYYFKQLSEPLATLKGDSDRNTYELFARFAEKLRDKISMMIDNRIYDPKRLIKIPGSLAIYKGDGAFLCSCLNTYADVIAFRPEEYMVEAIHTLPYPEFVKRIKEASTPRVFNHDKAMEMSINTLLKIIEEGR